MTSGTAAPAPNGWGRCRLTLLLSGAEWVILSPFWERGTDQLRNAVFGVSTGRALRTFHVAPCLRTTLKFIPRGRLCPICPEVLVLSISSSQHPPGASSGLSSQK